VEFRVLGPVEAYADGVRIDLGPRRRRFVLAVLALDVNRPVTVDRLIELTWPIDLPRTAEHAITVHMSQLRTTLAQVSAGTAEIVRQGRGYTLVADPSSVDAYRFRALVDSARTAADDTGVAALLDRALDLWRGDALACCIPDGADAALCRGLAEARLTAIEDRADARLRLGLHRALVDELSDLVGRHPSRERLAGQLMLALHRDGRTGDALAVYATTRDRLADELGLDPSPPLQALQSAVLRGDPDIDAPTAVLSDPASVPPITAPNQDLRVALVDDHPMFRAGMRIALETGTGISVVAEAGDVASAVAVIGSAQPDVVVMDLHLPDASGVEATREILACHPRTAILMMTMSTEDTAVVDALRAGARGYVLKSAGRDEVLNAVRTVAQGGAVFSADVARRLAVIASYAPPASK
jgi:DNA-binding SARP family transcriptional activator/ActR/RegA family two-component response regulator